MAVLTDEIKQKVKAELERFEHPRSAILPALYHVQDEYGWISKDAMSELAEHMDQPVADINEVATFYTMYNKTETGKYHIQVCTNISCAMKKGRELTEHILEKLDLKVGETSSDGKFTVSRVECLGSCDTAPVLQVNYDYHENMDEQKVDQLLEGL